MLAGIMWIGTSLYFVWLDSSFEPLKNPKKGVDGELYMVHGGNFYHVQKRRFGPGEMPPNLHWFKWEATLTWVTGFFLLVVVYYTTNGAYLVDPQIKNLSNTEAVLSAIGVLVASWFLYDFLFRSPLAKTKLINVFALAFVGGLIYFLTHTFSGRAAFIHLGAIFGTMMLLNVWVHILPNQQAIINASNSGLEPNYDLGKKAKTRSMHNSYMTLPVLFLMISNHFSSTYGHPLNWVVLILVTFLGAITRHGMITGKKWPFALAAVTLGVLMFMTEPNRMNLTAAERSGSAVEYSQVQAVMNSRCITCHSDHPTDDIFKIAPNNVRLETEAQLRQWAPKIYERVVVQKNMPLVNKTQMTDEERALMARFIAQGNP